MASELFRVQWGVPDHQPGRIGWANAPVCLVCWVRNNPGREPYRMLDMDRIVTETCCKCEMATNSGIYVRLHCEVLVRPNSRPYYKEVPE